MRSVERVVLISAVVLISIGVVLIYLGKSTNSVGLVADGVDSLGDSVVSLIVWLGLIVSHRGPDKKFHFGYYRFETLSSLLVAMIMFGMSIWIFYTSYSRLVNPEPVHITPISMIALVLAGTISLILAIIKNKMAAQHNLLSLKADAKNSIKDSSSSFVILTGIVLSYFGFAWGDSIGAMIVACYIAFIAIRTIKEASLVLVDAFNSPEIVEDISKIIRKYPTIKLKDMKLRMSGPFLNCIMIVKVSKNITLDELYKLKQKIKKDIMKEIDGIKNLFIEAEPARI